MAKAKVKAKKVPKAAKTAVFVEDYKGKPTFGIWNVDADGDKVGDYPLIAFGLKKAEALIDHRDELEEYVQDLHNEDEGDSYEEKVNKAKSSKKKESPKKKKKKPKVVRRSDSDSDED